MQDLSELATDSMWATCQADGNRAYLNNAMTAPGGVPAAGLPGEEHVDPAPRVDMIKPGDKSRPTPKTSMPATRPAWTKAGTD